MVKSNCLVVLGLFLIAGQPSFADDRAQIVGVWKLISWEREIQTNGGATIDLWKESGGLPHFHPRGANGANRNG